MSEKPTAFAASSQVLGLVIVHQPFCGSQAAPANFLKVSEVVVVDVDDVVEVNESPMTSPASHKHTHNTMRMKVNDAWWRREERAMLAA